MRRSSGPEHPGHRRHSLLRVAQALGGLVIFAVHRLSSRTGTRPLSEGRRGHRRGADGSPLSRRSRRWGILGFVKSVLSTWVSDRAPKMAAALAYYTAFAVAPLLLIAIAIAGLAFGQEAARGEVVRQIAGLVGQKGAETIQEILARAWQPGGSLIATILGGVAFILAASGVFGELQDSLNTIWKVQKKAGRGFLGTLKDRFLSFSMVVGLGFLLLVSLAVSAALSALGNYWAGSGGTAFLLRALNFGVSFGVVALLFASMFRVLPDARTRWRDIGVGAALTAVLFTAGKFVIGLYLGKSTVGNTYGAAGSFVIFLLWVNYSAQIVFLGAEFTKAYADRYGTPPIPQGDAQPLQASPRLH